MLEAEGGEESGCLGRWPEAGQGGEGRQGVEQFGLVVRVAVCAVCFADGRGDPGFACEAAPGLLAIGVGLDREGARGGEDLGQKGQGVAACAGAEHLAPAVGDEPVEGYRTAGVVRTAGGIRFEHDAGRCVGVGAEP